MAVAILVVPPAPSFSDLAASRPDSLPEAPQLSFFLPPEQRTLTEWVRLLRSQPDPELHAGDPVRISGFVLKRPGELPQLARLTVRCCLADATPAGIPILWPEDANPEADQWLEIEGTLIVQERDGVPVNVVKPTSIEAIARPRGRWSHDVTASDRSPASAVGVSCRSFRAGCRATAGSVATTASLAVGGYSADSIRSGGLGRGVQPADGS